MLVLALWCAGCSSTPRVDDAREAAGELGCRDVVERSAEPGGSAVGCRMPSGALLSVGLYANEEDAESAAEVVDEEVARYDLRAGRLLLVSDERAVLEQAAEVFGGALVDNKGRRLGR